MPVDGRQTNFEEIGMNLVGPTQKILKIMQFIQSFLCFKSFAKVLFDILCEHHSD